MGAEEFMTIPFDVVIGIALISLAIGGLIGAVLASRKLGGKRWIEVRYDTDLSGLPVLAGESEKYFRHELSATRRIA